MGVKIITPATEVIPVAELRAHCNADLVDTVDDPLLTGYLGAAVQLAEHHTGRSIGEQTLELALDAFPAGPIELLRGPVKSITSIKYIDSAGVEQTISNLDYMLDDYGLQNWALAAFDASWPSTLAAANAVKVRYVAGDLTPAVRSALLLLVGHLYDNREATTPNKVESIPLGVRALLDTVKSWSM